MLVKVLPIPSQFHFCGKCRTNWVISTGSEGLGCNRVRAVLVVTEIALSLLLLIDAGLLIRRPE